MASHTELNEFFAVTSGLILFGLTVFLLTTSYIAKRVNWIASHDYLFKMKYPLALIAWTIWLQTAHLTRFTDAVLLEFFPSIGSSSHFVSTKIIEVMWIVTLFFYLERNFIYLSSHPIYLINRQEPEWKRLMLLCAMVTRIVASIIVIAIVSHALGLNSILTAILTTGTFGSLAIGLASRDILANVLGGLQIKFQQPFVVGERIDTHNGSININGTVEHIGWQQTKLVRRDRRVIYVPNQNFTTMGLHNISRRSHIGTEIIFSVRYQDHAHIRTICKKVKSYIEKHVSIDKRMGLYVTMSGMGASSLDITARFWLRVVSWEQRSQEYHELLLRIIKIVHAEQADFPFSTITIDAPDIKIEQLKVKKDAT